MAKIPNREIIPTINNIMDGIKRIVAKKLSPKEIARIDELITTSCIDLSRKNLKSSRKIISKRSYDEDNNNDND